MNIEFINGTLNAARDCAMQMMYNAAYIQKELPTLELNVALRAKIEHLCSTLIGTKHDVITEAFEIDDLLRAPEPNEAHIKRKIEFIISMIQSDLAEMHEVVTTLEEAASRHTDGGSYLLVAESAVNIVNVPTAFADSAASLTAQTNASPFG